MVVTVWASTTHLRESHPLLRNLLCCFILILAKEPKDLMPVLTWRQVCVFKCVVVVLKVIEVCWRIKSLTGNVRMKHRRFGHKPWPSANAKGHVTRTDHVTGDEESASVPGSMCWTDWNGAPPLPPFALSEGCSTLSHMASLMPRPTQSPSQSSITTSVLLKVWRVSLQY